MDLFYTPPEHIDEKAGALVVSGDEFGHIVRVLRYVAGNTIFVTDGRGRSVRAEISSIGKKSLTAAIVSLERFSPPRTTVTIAISLLKSSQRFDMFIEKATELGVNRIIPMITSRTVSQPGAEKGRRKAERWKSMVIAASLQSKRLFFPEILPPVNYSEILGLEGYDMKFIAHETSLGPLSGGFSGEHILFAVGGEGGFSDNEVSQALRSGFTRISLGPSILRAETAGIFVAGLVRAASLFQDRNVHQNTTKQAGTHETV
ncbi:MAG TPA: 16S rRNA (uracil(1498)-N(3))-methyltransferase [Prosthecochloris aestuarii]|uniref:Ribosomal RNA small subunit methyltransferase E n=1 Tax=Prosthecochloris aestuarii TaxID=1102 RepID=A0A831WSF0_PROAE|nr:16S rRNA (uracil(1498)-N(3))-methyltransferase [Prosthecochloris sp.]HED31540.1 16S rRNA (uracil(1498)-N(3))-methyltransferase [Prosthecochloris aestuarii]